MPFQGSSATPPPTPESAASGGALIGLPEQPVSDLSAPASGVPNAATPKVLPGASPAGTSSTQATAAAASRTAVQAAPPQAGTTEAAASGAATKPIAAASSKLSGQAAEAQKAPALEVDMERTASIFRQLRMQLTPATRHATINLVPADLGRIVIHLTVKGGKVTGDIRADKEDTLRILEAHAPELRAALEQNGFESTDFNLSRHGDPSSGRSGEATSPLSATIGREQSGVPEGAPEEVRRIVRSDRVDTLA